MTYVLTANERNLLREMQFDHRTFQVKGQLPPGKAGKVTLDRLTKLGLLETGPGRWDETGWRLSDDGWRCMYGKTYDELMAGDAPHHPLKVWSWPPTPDHVVAAPKPGPRLKTLPPRLKRIN